MLPIPLCSQRWEIHRPHSTYWVPEARKQARRRAGGYQVHITKLRRVEDSARPHTPTRARRRSTSRLCLHHFCCSNRHMPLDAHTCRHTHAQPGRPARARTHKTHRPGLIRHRSQSTWRHPHIQHKRCCPARRIAMHCNFAAKCCGTSRWEWLAGLRSRTPTDSRIHNRLRSGCHCTT